jgi:hypothetical protein
MALAFCQCIQAQVLWNSNGQYRLEPHNPPQSFAIGPNFTSGYALDVHGEQMNPPLGNVFKTNADGPRTATGGCSRATMSMESCFTGWERNII